MEVGERRSPVFHHTLTAGSMQCASLRQFWFLYVFFCFRVRNLEAHVGRTQGRTGPPGYREISRWAPKQRVPNKINDQCRLRTRKIEASLSSTSTHLYFGMITPTYLLTHA